MDKKKIRFIFFQLLTLISYSAYSQASYEFIGVLKLTGDDKQIITYKLVFQENKGVISGYSVTDLNGTHETRNAISGFYNKKEKQFTFKENDILYTKSTFSKNSFCFVNFSGKVNLVNNTSKIEGNFKGLYKNNTKCIDGTVLLIGSDKIYKLVEKVNTKIQKSNKISVPEKQKYDVNKLLDSLVINKISSNENLYVFWESNTFKMDIWDASQEDGDIINLYHNNNLILKNYRIENKKKTINIELTSDKNVFVIESISEGDIAPNTPQLKLYDNKRSFDLQANLKVREKASLTIVKKE